MLIFKISTIVACTLADSLLPLLWTDQNQDHLPRLLLKKEEKRVKPNSLINHKTYNEQDQLGWFKSPVIHIRGVRRALRHSSD